MLACFRLQRLGEEACAQGRAGSIEQVRLPRGWGVCAAERVQLNGCAYHVAGVAVLSGLSWVGLLTAGWRARSPEQVQLNGCAYNVAGVCCAVLYGFRRVCLPCGWCMRAQLNGLVPCCAATDWRGLGGAPVKRSQETEGAGRMFRAPEKIHFAHLKHGFFHQNKGKPPFTRQCSGV